MQFWHRLRGHRQYLRKFTRHSLWDINPHGLYLVCSCGKAWPL